MSGEADAADDFEIAFDEPGAPSTTFDLAAHYRARIESGERASALQIAAQIGERVAARMQAWCGRPLFAGLSAPADAARTPDAYVAVHRFRLGSCGEPIELIVPPSALDCVIAALFGGEPDDAPRDRLRLSSVDRHVLAELVAAFESAVAELALAHARVACKRAESADDLVPAAWRKPGDAVIVVTLAATPAGGPAVRLLVPKALAPMLVAAPPAPAAATDPARWRRRLHDAVLEAELPLRCLVAEPEVSLARLLALASGDLLPLDPSGGVRVDVAGTPIAVAEPGEQDDRRAVRITAYLADRRAMPRPSGATK